MTTQPPKLKPIPAAPRIEFVRAEQDDRGRWLHYYHRAMPGGAPRVPITEDGFLIRGGEDWAPVDLFVPVGEMEAKLAKARTK